jgi:bifunctional non-homologous end joining protein LigD
MASAVLNRRGKSAGSRRISYPRFLPFCDPTLREKTPNGDGWLHEIKIDGYRAQLNVANRKVVVYSRSGYDWTEQFARIAEAGMKLDARQAIIDGEAAVHGNTGLPDFQTLRRELGNPGASRLLYYAFDLLYLDGVDLRRTPLIERKQALRTLLDGAPSTFVYVDHLEGPGAVVFEKACGMRLEGIVSKRANSHYLSGRQDSWIKTKCVQSDTYPIIAFVEKLGARPRKIASLYVGKREGKRMLYAGKARSGYTEKVARELREKLDPLIRTKTPLDVPVKKPKATWVEPVVDAEIEYSGITDDGLLRAAVFKGLREDLKPVKRAPRLVPQQSARRSVKGVPSANILQLLPDAIAPTKEELERYWRKVAKRALAYLGNRPLKLVRNTHGVTFYHKGPLPPIPDAVHQFRLEKREGGEGVRVWVDDLAGLLGLVAMDVVEVHPWAATVDDIERPDHLVFDLDPGSGVAWDFVVETALMLRRSLEDEGYDSWLKLTGGKGLHLMVPIKRRITHDAARAYCKQIARRLETNAPDKYTISPEPSRRKGRIYIDYLRNGRGTTAVGAYSPRARAGTPIAVPVTWRQVERGVRPDAFTLNQPFKGK